MGRDCNRARREALGQLEPDGQRDLPVAMRDGEDHLAFAVEKLNLFDRKATLFHRDPGALIGVSGPLERHALVLVRSAAAAVDHVVHGHSGLWQTVMNNDLVPETILGWDGDLGGGFFVVLVVAGHRAVDRAGQRECDSRNQKT